VTGESAGRNRDSWFRRNRVIFTLLAVGTLALGYAIVVVTQALTRPAADSHAAPGAGTVDPTGADPSARTSAGPSARPTPSARKGPTPSPTRRTGGGTAPPPSVSGFPNANNTGVPAGTNLTNYTGSCTITTNNVVIDAKTINCDVAIRAKGVVIKRSKINGQLGTSEETPYSYTLQDSEVDAGVVQGAAVGSTNMTILRSDIRGGATSVYCYSNCTVRESWLHGQRLPAGADWHLGAFLANDDGLDPGGTTNAVLVHNTIHCDALPNSADGGCSGNINLYGDFGPISHVTIDNNLFGANTGISYCVYGGESSSKPYPNADHVVIINNVFQRGTNGKCGAFGPVSSFSTSRPGNQWTNNVWDNGAPVGPAN